MKIPKKENHDFRRTLLKSMISMKASFENVKKIKILKMENHDFRIKVVFGSFKNLFFSKA